MTRARSAWAVVACAALGCEVPIEFRSRADGAADSTVSADSAVDGSSAQDVAVSDVAVSDVAVSDVAVSDSAVSDGAVSDSAVSDAGGDGALGCATDAECGAGRMCSAGVCVLRCVPTLEQCNGVDDDCDGATDEDLDPMNPLCAAGQACRSGACVSIGACPAGLTSCAGACVSLQSDARNCGSCGSACAAGQRCSAGVCTL